MIDSRVNLVPVQNRREQKQFLELPWRLYRDDPYWIPPLRTNQRELLGYKSHPFYETAEIQTFLAVEDGQVKGRVAAILDHAHNRHYDQRRGGFGFFESVNDSRVSNALLEGVRQWLAERDIHQIRGPVNPSMNYECGLLVDGFDRPPVFMMTYNQPYYGGLLEEFGFTKIQDLFAFYGHVDMLKSLDQKIEFIIHEAKRRFEVNLRPMNRRRFRQEIQTFLDIYNRSMLGHWGFVPLSPGELKHMAASLRHLIVPELTTVAEIDGKPIGVVFGLLDYNPRIKQIDGRLFPFGFFRLLTRRREIRRVRLITTNVLPEYQRWGVGVLLLHRLVPEALEWGMEEAEFSWVAESNKLSRGSLKRGGAQLYKTYRIYDYPGESSETTSQ